MAFDYNFDASLGSYVATFGAVAFDGASGNSAVGCLKYGPDTAGMSVENTTGQAAAASQKLYFNYRIVGKTVDDITFAALGFTLTYADATQTSFYIMWADVALEDTGWVQFASTTLPFPTGHGDYTRLDISGGVPNSASNITIYIDSIVVSDTPPALTTSTFALTHSSGGIPGAVAI